MAVIVALAAPVAVAIAVTQTSPPPGSPDARQTQAAETRTLRVVEEVEGTLGHPAPYAVVARRSGTLVWSPATGATVERGDPLFVIDDQPVLLLIGDVPAWRPLAEGTAGDDVRQLEQNLVELGYGDGLVVDGEFGTATTAAVEAWQADAGAPVDGSVELGEVTFLPAPAWVAARELEAGSPVQPGARVIQVSQTERVVALDLPVDLRRDVAVGGTVEVALGDASVVTATVLEVSGAVETDAQSRAQTVAVVLAFDDSAPVADGPVTVLVVRQEREDVLAVPVHALLALLEGGYAVEVVDGTGGISVRAVDVGLFADGWVEVTGDLTAGDEVVVP